MLPEPDRLVRRIVEMQKETNTRWHERTPDNLYSGLIGLACQLHQCNFHRWHEEEASRADNAADTRVAQAKRAIDRYDQERQICSEKFDQALIGEIELAGMYARPPAPINTETPGLAIHRLSMLSLCIFHMEAQLQQDDVAAEQRHRLAARLLVCQEQHRDLTSSITELCEDLFAGRKRLKLYRQMRIYRDSLAPASSPTGPFVTPQIASGLDDLIRRAG